MKLLLSHPSLTALTLNQKEKNFGATPVMFAVMFELELERQADNIYAALQSQH